MTIEPSSLAHFEEIVEADFEYTTEDGEPPFPVCLVYHERRSGRRTRIWMDDLHALSLPPYRIDQRAVFVCYSAVAELSCHLALGWPYPVNVLDLYVLFRAHRNGVASRKETGLVSALRYFGIDPGDVKKKELVVKRIIAGPPFTSHERSEILEYCDEDVDRLARLLPCLVP